MPRSLRSGAILSILFLVLRAPGGDLPVGMPQGLAERYSAARVKLIGNAASPAHAPRRSFEGLLLRTKVAGVKYVLTSERALANLRDVVAQLPEVPGESRRHFSQIRVAASGEGVDVAILELRGEDARLPRKLGERLAWVSDARPSRVFVRDAGGEWHAAQVVHDRSATVMGQAWVFALPRADLRPGAPVFGPDGAVLGVFGTTFSVGERRFGVFTRVAHALTMLRTLKKNAAGPPREIGEWAGDAAATWYGFWYASKGKAAPGARPSFLRTALDKRPGAYPALLEWTLLRLPNARDADLAGLRANLERVDSYVPADPAVRLAIAGVMQRQGEDEEAQREIEWVRGYYPAYLSSPFPGVDTADR